MTVDSISSQQPAPDALDLLPTGSMLPLWRRIHKEFILRSQKWGLPANICQVLIHLYLHPDSSAPAEMADANYYPRQTMTFILDSMEQAGLVLRKPHANDRRRKIVELTAKGRTLAHDIFQDLLQFEATAIQAIGGPDLTVIRLLHRYAEALAAQNDANGVLRQPGPCAAGTRPPT